jgi:hypothetical protein
LDSSILKKLLIFLRKSVSSLYFFIELVIFRIGVQKMNTTQRYLVSAGEIARALARQSKSDHISRIIELVGEDRAGLLLLKFAGESISFPRKSSLWRIAKAEHIQKELMPFRKNPHEFKVRVRKLSRLLKMSKPAIVRTFKLGRYNE